MADEQKKSSVGAPRLDPPERIQKLVELHRERPKWGLRRVAYEYIDQHPEILDESRGSRASVARRLADRLSEAVGRPERRARDRAALHELRGALLYAMILLDEILGPNEDL